MVLVTVEVRRIRRFAELQGWGWSAYNAAKSRPQREDDIIRNHSDTGH